MIHDRLNEIVSYAKLSNRAFAIKCGIKQPTLDKQLRGISAVSLETIIAVCATFPDISREWLLMGEGEMLKSNSKDADRLSKLIDTITTLQDTINAKTDTIATLNEHIKQLESQLKSK